MIKGFMIFMLFVALLFIAIGYFYPNYRTKNRIIYRYKKISFDEDQDNLPFPSDVFKTMFTMTPTWVSGIYDEKLRKEEDVNKYFISQE